MNGEIISNTIIGNMNTPLTIMDRAISNKKERKKEIEDSHNNVDQLDSTNK
jgi:hypothetical protein